jgi:hypothetical protein
MICLCPLCGDSEWQCCCDDEDDEEEDEEVFFEICDSCFIEEDMLFYYDALELCGYLQDCFLFCEDLFLKDFEAA